MRKWLGFTLCFVIAVALAIFATTPPPPRSANAPTADFSQARAFADVRALARAPRTVGTPRHDSARRFLERRLQSLGFTVSEQRAELGDYATKRIAKWSGDATPREAVNIIGVRMGTDPALPAILLMAHYDSVWGSPGAADDAAGVAAILETARALSVRGPLKRDLIVLLTDAEELGLDGARAFFAAHPLAGRAGAVINLEARGGGGVAFLFQLSPANGNAVRAYAGAVDRPSTSSLAAYIYSILPNDTDLTMALNRGGYAAYNISFIGRPQYYHSPLATPATLDPGALQHLGDQALALTSALGNAGTLPAPSSDAVFFDLIGLATIIYPPWLGWVMLALGAGGLALAWARRRDRGSVVSGALRMSGLMVGSGLLLHLLNLLSGVPGEYYDRLAAIRLLSPMAMLGFIVAFLALFGGLRAKARTRVGAALPMLGFALVGQALVPTAAYVIVIPIAIAGLVEGIATLWGKRAGRIAAMIGMISVSGYLIAFMYRLMQGIGADMPWAAVPMAAAMILGWLPLWRPLRMARPLALVALGGAVVLALVVRLDPVAPTVPVYASDK